MSAVSHESPMVGRQARLAPRASAAFLPVALDAETAPSPLLAAGASAEAVALIEKAYVRDPHRITPRQWIDLVLGGSAFNRVGRGHAETFTLRAPIFGNVVAYFCRDRWHYWRLHSAQTLTHDEILALCRAAG